MDGLTSYPVRNRGFVTWVSSNMNKLVKKIGDGSVRLIAFASETLFIPFKLSGRISSNFTI